jgi:dihydroxy-acid dehydratase
VHRRLTGGQDLRDAVDPQRVARAAGGGLALLETGDRVRVDLGKGEANVLIAPDELERRRARLAASGGYRSPDSQTPWQELYRQTVGQHATGACMEMATRYQDIIVQFGPPRHSH